MENKPEGSPRRRIGHRLTIKSLIVDRLAALVPTDATMRTCRGRVSVPQRLRFS